MTGKDEAVLERMHFDQRIRETGISQHLSNTALVLVFIMLGRKMWRDSE